MPDSDNKNKDTVSLEELAISNMWQIEAIARVLERKGLLTQAELLDELIVLKQEHKEKFN